MNLTLLKEFFAGFLRTRHFARHFRRLALLESFSDASVSRDLPPSLAHTLVTAANDDATDLLQRLGSHTDGLSEAEAQPCASSMASTRSSTSSRCRGGRTCGIATRTPSTCC